MSKTAKDFREFITKMAQSEPHQKIPKECPRLKECKYELLESEYASICCTEAWVFCKYSARKSMKYRKPPYFWKFTQKIQKVKEEK